MKYNPEFLLAFLFLILSSSCSTDDSASPDTSADESTKAKIISNVSYGSDEAQVFDLYLPTKRSSEKTKLIVFIHGGGWIQGDKADMEEYIPLLQEMHPEHAIANLNYRLAEPGVRAAFPNQFLDVQQALEHIAERAEDWSINPQFALVGVSAGGHLALQFDSVYDEEDRVKMVCSIVGPTDLTDPFYTEIPEYEFALTLLIDETAYSGVTDYVQAVSPARLIHSNSSPTIMFYGEDDPLVPVRNGILLKEQFDIHGVSNSFQIYEGGHGDWITNDHNDLQLQLSTFIEMHFGID